MSGSSKSGPSLVELASLGEAGGEQSQSRSDDEVRMMRQADELLRQG